MEEPMDEGSPSRIPGLNLAGNPHAEDAPASASSPPLARRSDRIQDLLEIIILTFRFDFERLPPEAQRSYDRFLENKSYNEFAATLKGLVLGRRLDGFMEGSSSCLIAVTKLFDSRYPHLGLKKLRDDLVSGRKRAGSGAGPRRRSPQSPRRAQKEALRETRNEQASESSRRTSQANLASTLTLPGRVRTRARSEGRVVHWARIEPSSTQADPETAGPSSDIPPTPIEVPEPADTLEDQSAPTQRPLLPGFTISTRTVPVDPGSNRPAVEGSGREQTRQEESIAWLRDYNEARGGPKYDFNLYPYKGWKIEPPEILLHRAINFLADEDIDRTLNWGQKFAELTEYFSYLLHNWQGEEWGAELHEAIDMLHTHWLFEQYHYGRPKLNLKFDNVWPKYSKRLPPIPGVETTVEKPQSELGERRLLLNEIRPAIDYHYELPGDDLERYIDLYASEASNFWESAPHSRFSRHELAQIENNAFEKCVFSGMSTTDSLIRASEAKFKSESQRSNFSQSALQAFATLRGSQRAALQQTLNQLDNSENLAVCNIFRTLILPPPKIPEKPDAGVLFPTIQVAEVPEEESRDPFSYTVAHRWYLEAERFWKEWGDAYAVKQCYSHKQWEERERPIMDLPKNWLGPFVYDFLDHDMKKTLELLKRCETLLRRIFLQDERAPRPFLADMTRVILEGLSGRPWDETELDFKGEDFMSDPQDLAHIRPLEEDFLRLLGMESIHSNTVDPEINHDGISPLSAIFEQRVREIMYPRGSASSGSYDFSNFMVSLNEVCDGPVKRWRFSDEEALEELEHLDRRGVIELNEDNIVSCPVPDLHPEQRVRWLDTDDDLDAYMQGVKATSGGQPDNGDGDDGDDSDDSGGSDDEDEIMTISTDVSFPESEDLGNYMFGLPKIQNLRSWVRLGTASGREDSDRDMPRNHRFFQRLCFRLGKTIKDLRARMETYRRQLTPEEQDRNRYFLDTMVTEWESNTRTRPELREYNPNKPDLSDDSFTQPDYAEIMHVCHHEHDFGEDGYPEITYGCQDDNYRISVDAVRKEILREAYENKSMLLPNRIDRGVDEKGLRTRSPLRREPVWSFAHPDRRGKAPRFWDINRWPLHLQSESTAESIRSGRFYKPVASPLTPESAKESRISVRAATPLVSPISSVLPRVQREMHREVQPGTTTMAPDMTESMDTSENQVYSFPGFGENFTVTFQDLADSRQTLTTGSSQYLLGDTPLQKKHIEDLIKSGIQTEEPPTWTQRLGTLFGRKNDPVDPGALPKVNPRYIPESKPRREPEGSDDELAQEEGSSAAQGEGSSAGSEDVEMNEAAMQLWEESQAGPSSERRSSSAQAPSPIDPTVPTEPDSSSVSPTEPGTTQGRSSSVGLWGQGLPGALPKRLRLRQATTEILSHPVELEVIEPESELPEQQEETEESDNDSLFGS
ncbi:hypothetical protein FDENT_79 [Fusarium denticulatum]|uniref:Uncharacterized protein n=1 Tax=Fusarium denticulatum TaxID=48507 RepID=A0A8H6CXE9_9HYPO|nr:hypothetical protein FDENT_79 [Fusarium denticulatum]